ncbi:MAG: PD-(D/E)XK nuclease family protein [Aestuariibacter sp.]|nr:PD-(D/E)XK nuclease family protein [Aestuariibacter sp.]
MEDKAKRARFRRSTRDKARAYVLPKPPPIVQRYTYTELEAKTSPTGRVYKTPAGRFASITTMLSKTQDESKAKILQEWRDAVGEEQAQATLEESGIYGTLVHDTMEAYLKHETINPDKLHPLAKRAVKELCHELEGNFEETWALEVPLYSESLRIAGRTDVVGVWKGKPVILDYKTSRNPKKREDIGDYFVQLLFYALAHNELHGTNIRHGVIAMAVMTGKPQVFEVDLWDKNLWATFEEKLVKFHGEHFYD